MQHKLLATCPHPDAQTPGADAVCSTCPLAAVCPRQFTDGNGYTVAKHLLATDVTCNFMADKQARRSAYAGMLAANGAPVLIVRPLLIDGEGRFGVIHDEREWDAVAQDDGIHQVAIQVRHLDDLHAALVSFASFEKDKLSQQEQAALVKLLVPFYQGARRGPAFKDLGEALGKSPAWVRKMWDCRSLVANIDVSQAILGIELPEPFLPEAAAPAQVWPTRTNGEPVPSSVIRRFATLTPEERQRAIGVAAATNATEVEAKQIRDQIVSERLEAAPASEPQPPTDTPLRIQRREHQVGLDQPIYPGDYRAAIMGLREEECHVTTLDLLFLLYALVRASGRVNHALAQFGLPRWELSKIDDRYAALLQHAARLSHGDLTRLVLLEASHAASASQPEALKAG